MLMRVKNNCRVVQGKTKSKNITNSENVSGNDENMRCGGISFSGQKLVTYYDSETKTHRKLLQMLNV